MKNFERGGIVRGGTSDVRITPDECVIVRDGICLRTDDAHAAAIIPTDRFWICPTHD